MNPESIYIPVSKKAIVMPLIEPDVSLLILHRQGLPLRATSSEYL